jgi:hypothetical protein
MKDGMKQAQRLTHVQGAAAVGIYLLFSSLVLFVLVWSIVEFHLSVEIKGSAGGALPSSRLARRRRGSWLLSYSILSPYTMNKTKTKTP